MLGRCWGRSRKLLVLSFGKEDVRGDFFELKGCHDPSVAAANDAASSRDDNTRVEGCVGTQEHSQEWLWHRQKNVSLADWAQIVDALILYWANCTRVLWLR